MERTTRTTAGRCSRRLSRVRTSTRLLASKPWRHRIVVTVQLSHAREPSRRATGSGPATNERDETRRTSEPPTPPGAYQPIIATGVHGLALVDVRQNATNAYAGAGLSLRFPRSTGDSGRGFALDVDVMRACCGATPERSDWAYDVLTGLDLFSENLENGQRRWLNPFLGLRVGSIMRSICVDGRETRAKWSCERSAGMPTDPF